MSRIKRLELHNIFHDSKEQLKTERQSELVNFLAKQFNCLNNESQIRTINLTLHSKFFNRYFQKWEMCNRINDRFIKKNLNWLNEEISFDFENIENTASTSSKYFIIYSELVCGCVLSN